MSDKNRAWTGTARIDNRNRASLEHLRIFVHWVRQRVKNARESYKLDHYLVKLDVEACTVIRRLTLTERN